MTLLDRALTKAYSRRAAPQRTVPQRTVPQRTGDDAALPAPITRGWVARLRPPMQRSTVARAVTAAELRESPAVAPEPAVHAISAPPLAPEIRETTKLHSMTGASTNGLRVPLATSSGPARTAMWAWPAICDRLLESSAGAGIRGLSSLLCEMLAERRQRSLAFTGPGRGAGRTSLLLTIARLLTEERALRVLVIDVDFGNPQLAQFLGVEAAPDLWQAVCQHPPLSNPLITLIPDRLSLAPLCERVSMTEVTPERAQALRGLTQRWRREFDLVLVDGGPWELFGSLVVRESSTAEACVCISRGDKGAAGGTDGDRYRQTGLDFLGFIETFAEVEAQVTPSRTR